MGRAVRPVDSLVSSDIEVLERKRDDNKSTKNATQNETHKVIDHPLKQNDLKRTNQYERTINPEEYAIKIKIKAVYHDGKSLKDDEALLFRVSSDNSKVFVTHNGSIVDNTVFSRHGIKAITFGNSHKSILIEIHESSYIFIKHLNNDTFLHDYFSGTALWKFKGRIADEHLIDTMTQLDSQRKRANGTTEPSETENVSRNKEFSPVAPLSAYSIPLRRSTRERRPPSGNKMYVLEPIEETETPAKFSPPLSYKFHDNKVFTVTQNDFKTLYNNDWINDTVIDFFIKYDIDKAVHKLNKFTVNEIYAFNSFFFTKLISSEEYYANVKRWLNKIDLMLFPYIIIPINENLHWYGCIIRGLPELLERKKNEIDLTNEAETEVTETEVNEPEVTEPEIETSPNSQDILEVPNPQGRKRAEIFIFDSLSQRHNNIHIPLKLFIIDYCMDKHNIAIRKDEIRIQHARVPRQNNFNDCGIHVIYNIRKWLGHSTEIEKVWRNYQRAAYRSYFVAEERNKMRRELIDLLLKLHEEQVHVDQGTHESEDEVEVIEELLRSASQEASTKETEKETKTNPIEPKESGSKSSLDSKEKTISDIMISFGQKPEKSNESESTTLDPRQIKNPFINYQIREIFAGLLIVPLIYEMINKLFPDAQEKVPAQDLAKLQRLATSISSLDRQSEKNTKDVLSHWETQLSQKLEQRRPKDESFVIRDENDDKLNRSVHDLSIKGSSDDLLSEVLFQADSSTPSKTYGDKSRNATKRRRLNS